MAAEDLPTAPCATQDVMVDRLVMVLSASVCEANDGSRAEYQ